MIQRGKSFKISHLCFNNTKKQDLFYADMDSRRYQPPACRFIIIKKNQKGKIKFIYNHL